MGKLAKSPGGFYRVSVSERTLNIDAASIVTFYIGTQSICVHYALLSKLNAQ